MKLVLVEIILISVERTLVLVGIILAERTLIIVEIILVLAERSIVAFPGGDYISIG